MTPRKNSRAILLEAIPERDFMQQIVDLADVRGWWHYHTHDSQRSEEGFPDLVLVRLEEAKRIAGGILTSPRAERLAPWVKLVSDRPALLTRGNAGRIIFAEIKAQKGIVSPAQKRCLALLALAEAEAYLWRPSDWDRIVEVLT